MKHSLLTNPTDLHYAKIRTFTGNPLLFAPDFTDQILAAIDTNKVYRATGTTQGAIVELLASPQDNGQPSGQSYTLVSTFSGSPAAITPDFADQLFVATDTNKIYRSTSTTIGALVELAPSSSSSQEILITGTNYPNIIPAFVGQQYFYRPFTDIGISQTFIARGLGAGDWFPVGDQPEIFIDVVNGTGLEIYFFDLYFTKELPTADFNFTNLVCPAIPVGLSKLPALSTRGTGYYVLTTSPSVVNLSDVRVYPTTPTTRLTYFNETIFESESSGVLLTADGKPLDPTMLKFRQFPITPTKNFNAGQPFTLSFEAYRLTP